MVLASANVQSHCPLLKKLPALEKTGHEQYVTELLRQEGKFSNWMQAKQ